MDVFSIGDGRFLEQVIQAVTLVSGSGDFVSMAKIGVLFGIILITFQALTSGGRNFNFTQIGIAGLVYALMFGSTQTVTVTDAYTQEVRVVDNVPTGVAATGSFLSGIGFNLTELFETAFSTPTMTTQGYAFSLDVLKRVRMNSLTEFHLGNANAGTPNTNFTDSWSEYIKTCALPAMELGFITKDDLFRTTDFLSELAVEDPNRAALLKVTPEPQTVICNEAFDALETYTQNIFLPTFKNDVLPGVLGLLPPENNAVEVEQRINDALNGLGVGPAPQSNFTANAPPVDANDFIITSVLVPIYYKAVRERYVQDGNFIYADQLDDAVRARNSQWMANQSLFDRYLRPMMTFIEGFVFAATPILSLLIPVGAIGIGAAGRFLLVGAWIQLWMPALAIVNLFLHDVVAGKMAALADAGTPLTSLAGLQQGDDIIQTWLATGGLMASAVPVLTLMLVYGGAISANFFATRLQGEDVVTERQAAGATFNPYPQLQVEPPNTFNQTAGIAHQTGAEAFLGSFAYSNSAALRFDSASEARMQASDQFGQDLRQSVNNAWSDQATASVMQSNSHRWVAENGQTESAVRQNFSDIIEDIATKTDVSHSDATNWVAQGALGLSLYGTGGGVSLNDTDTRIESSAHSESWKTQIAEKIGDSSELRANLSEAVAADIQGSTSDAVISSETLGQDETLSASAQEVVSASKAYSESVSSGASMEASRSIAATDMVPLIASNHEASSQLNELTMRYGLAGDVETFQDHQGERIVQAFDGDVGLAETYAQAHIASQHIGSGGEHAAEIQAELNDVFHSATGGFSAHQGDAGAHSSIMDSAPAFGSASTAVSQGMATGPAAAQGYQDRQAGIAESVENHMTAIPSAHDNNVQTVEAQMEAFDAQHQDGVAANHVEQEQVRDKHKSEFIDDLDPPIHEVDVDNVSP